VEQNVLETRPREVRTRFELAARRLVETWLEAGSMQVSASDMRIAREFLELTGMRVEETPGVLVRLSTRGGRAQEVTREVAFLMALRRLAEKDAA
jgi:hypothetical protein